MTQATKTSCSPTTIVRCPGPCVSVTKSTLPGANVRRSPSPASICPTPDRTKIKRLPGAGCQSTELNPCYRLTSRRRAADSALVAVTRRSRPLLFTKCQLGLCRLLFTEHFFPVRFEGTGNISGSTAIYRRPAYCASELARSTARRNGARASSRSSPVEALVFIADLDRIKIAPPPQRAFLRFQFKTVPLIECPPSNQQVLESSVARPRLRGPVHTGRLR